MLGNICVLKCYERVFHTSVCTWNCSVLICKLCISFFALDLILNDCNTTVEGSIFGMIVLL